MVPVIRPRLVVRNVASGRRKQITADLSYDGYPAQNLGFYSVDIAWWLAHTNVSVAFVSVTEANSHPRCPIKEAGFAYRSR